MELKYTTALDDILTGAISLASLNRSRIVTPEHILMMAFSNSKVMEALNHVSSVPVICEVAKKVRERVYDMERIPDDDDTTQVMLSYQYQVLLKELDLHCASASIEEADIPHLMHVLYELKDSYAANSLHVLVEKASKGEFMRYLTDACNQEESEDDGTGISDDDEDDFPFLDDPIIDDDDDDDTEGSMIGPGTDRSAASGSWRDYVLCINDHLADHNPLIGREAELDRTVQVLCRKDKNNPLHIGEPGVGKTSIVYGLAQRIEDANVPESLRNVRIYQLDLGSLIAGTQYRGDFEKRLKMVMKGVAAEKGAILYIDEIHNIVGAGQTGEGSMDASNLLKPYLEGGKVRFIGATTYEEYNRNLARSKGLIRRFQTIDIVEPSIDETIKILQELKPNYEAFHHVKYNDDAIEFAVKASARYINDRYLPDKAIDLIDEAGAFVNMKGRRSKTVDKQLIADVLAKVSKIDALAMKENDNTNLENLYQRMNSVIYGQDEALRSVVEAVQLSKAGLTDETKPLASLLFVGPTGVGKTEVAKVLAKEMGVQLIRFDMSEYVEKHTVAKLIGSPAGYVGYEDGGLLTDAVRKSPDCVLLLDEIEKAHPDVFNILLQVLDDGRLTDNKGRTVDFKNTILIMTSNLRPDLVKESFRPEFINRIDEIITFHELTPADIRQIVQLQIGQLKEKMASMGITIEFTEDFIDYLSTKGYDPAYGARPVKRVLQRELIDELAKKLLDGSLSRDSVITATFRDGKLALS